MILPAAASFQRWGGRGYHSGYCVHYSRFLYRRLCARRSAGLAVIRKPNLRETRISHSRMTCASSILAVCSSAKSATRSAVRCGHPRKGDFYIH
jgi:hypothetical protein